MNEINTKLKDLIVRDAEFIYYRQGELWYTITEDGETLFEFPVPISDTGTGVFHSYVRAATLMRWIRKHLENIEEGKILQGI